MNAPPHKRKGFKMRKFLKRNGERLRGNVSIEEYPMF